MSVRSNIRVASSIALFLLSVSMLACNKTEPEPILEAEIAPRPELTPEQVVKIQLEAIRESDGSDEGLATAYRFNSPDHKQRMGTVGRFGEIVKSSKFQAMLGYRAAEYGSTRIEGGRARNIVTLQDEQGRVQMFLFELRKQETGPDKGCWLTERFYPSELNFAQPLSNSGSHS
jgi:hypothetical protein